MKQARSIFRYHADKRPIAIFCGLFGLDVLVFYLDFAAGWLLLYAVLAWLPKTMITAWNHHHQHVPTFFSPILNFGLEVVYSFQTGVLPNGWVLHHNLGHHPNFTKGALDESAWVRPNGRVMQPFEYTVRVSLLSYPLIVRNCFRFAPRYGIRFGLGALASLAVFLFFYLQNPFAAIVLFLIPGVCSIFATVWHTYKHHAGLLTEKEEEASWNMLDPFYNKLTGNLGYHTAHHISCGTHWSRLPDLHAKLQDRIPGHLYRSPGMPFPLFHAIWTSFKWLTRPIKKMQHLLFKPNANKRSV